MKLTQHPLSAAFPRMTGDEFQALKDSIESIGVQTPVTLFEGQVIDGWHRYTAANEVGMPCPSKLLGNADPVDFVRAQNATRRNMTPAQTAMAITAIYQWHPAHRPNKSALSAESPKSSKQLAEIAGVGARSIEQAKEVQTNAVPAVQAAVKSGEIDLPKAAAIAKMPPAQQAAAITKPLPKPTLTVVAPPAPPEDDQGDAVAILSEENDRLNDRLATVAMDATDEERAAAGKTITELRAENKLLRINLKAVTQSRDTAMNELAMVKRQCISQQFKIKKLQAAQP